MPRPASHLCQLQVKIERRLWLAARAAASVRVRASYAALANANVPLCECELARGTVYLLAIQKHVVDLEMYKTLLK